VRRVVCQEDYVVLDPAGKELYKSPSGGTGNNLNVNDPTGGMIHVRFSESGAGTTMLLDAIDAAGNIRWTRALPDVFGKGDSRAMRVGLDRQGKVLTVWSSERRYGTNAWAGQWFDPAGTPGAVFHAATGRRGMQHEQHHRRLRWHCGAAGPSGARDLHCSRSPVHLHLPLLAGVLPVVSRERESDEVVRTGSIGDENVSGPRRDPGRALTLLL
jgi:hypothetical protein